jgi:hypothetical protein
MPRVFVSHSSRDSRQAIAVKRWLVEAEPGLAEEIFLHLDLNPHTGIRPGECWKQALQQANTRSATYAVVRLFLSATSNLGAPAFLMLARRFRSNPVHTR